MTKVEKALRGEHQRLGMYLGMLEDVMNKRQRRQSLETAWYETELLFQKQKRTPPDYTQGIDMG